MSHSLGNRFYYALKVAMNSSLLQMTAIFSQMVSVNYGRYFQINGVSVNYGRCFQPNDDRCFQSNGVSVNQCAE